MHIGILPLNALRAFEAAARHLSFAKAAGELHVTPGALSHIIRGLEAKLGARLFERRVRAIALTPTGKLLYPGLQLGFRQIRDAVEGIGAVGQDNVLVVSTPPGFTAKWLAPRLYKFAQANSDLDVRVSSGVAPANFVADGVDVAVRNLPNDALAAPELIAERLAALTLIPVCSPGVMQSFAARSLAQMIRHVPLIHDESLLGRADVPGWPEWLSAAGLAGADLDRGLRFSSADHALDAAIEGAGLLLAHAMLAHDDLRTGRLVCPFGPELTTGRGYYFVCPAARQTASKIERFRLWLRQEIGAMAMPMRPSREPVAPPPVARRRATRSAP